MSSFGQRFKNERIKKKLTQEELASMFHLQKSSISRYENDKQMPETELLGRFADFFGVPVDYLLGREMTFTDILGELLKPHSISLGTYYPDSEDNKRPRSLKELLNIYASGNDYELSQKDIDLYKKYSNLSDDGKRIVEMLIEELSKK